MRGFRACLLAGAFALALRAAPLEAQGYDPGGGAPGGQQGDGPGGSPSQGPPPPPYGRHHQDHGPDGPPSSSGPTRSTMRGGLQLGPPGRWWDDPDFAANLHLRPEQQTRMDSIFAQNKVTLQAKYDSLREEERQLQSLTLGSAIDEHALFAHIDRVSQARAELEKANAHMLLLLRRELSADQVTALDDRRPPPR